MLFFLINVLEIYKVYLIVKYILSNKITNEKLAINYSKQEMNQLINIQNFLVG